jgi:Flp pilus assembly protein TadB
MNTSVLSSTFLLTLLLLVGLFFFIRASIKDRTQQIKLTSSQSDNHPEAPILEQVQQYFAERAYRVSKVDKAQSQVTLEGFVRPSIFLAVFLSGLAAVGLFCLALVLSILFPKIAWISLALVLLSPLAGFFYWRGAGRTEQVLLQVEAITEPTSAGKTLITITAHRDELAELQKSLSMNVLN